MTSRNRNASIAATFLFLMAALVVAVFIFSEAQPPQSTCPDWNECPDGACPIRLSKLAMMSVDYDDVPLGYSESVVLDLPPELRQKNWGGGSCVHASNVTLLRWQGQHELADWWRQQYSGGEYSDRLTKRMESAGLRYAFTKQGDMAFLEWCCRTRRGAGIFYKPAHSINLVGLDDQYAYLLDNNATDYPEQHGEYERVSRAAFENQWRRHYGGFAWTLVYNPPPPTPYVSPNIQDGD